MRRLHPLEAQLRPAHSQLRQRLQWLANIRAGAQTTRLPARCANSSRLPAPSFYSACLAPPDGPFPSHSRLEHVPVFPLRGAVARVYPLPKHVATAGRTSEHELRAAAGLLTGTGASTNNDHDTTRV